MVFITIIHQHLGKEYVWIFSRNHQRSKSRLQLDGSSTKTTCWKIDIVNPKSWRCLVQMIFLFNWVFFTFHLHFLGCISRGWRFFRWLLRIAKNYYTPEKYECKYNCIAFPQVKTITSPNVELNRQSHASFQKAPLLWSTWMSQEVSKRL